MIQGTPESRMTPESLNSIYVRTPAGMSPVQEFCRMERVYGPANINRQFLLVVDLFLATGRQNEQSEDESKDD